MELCQGVSGENSIGVLQCPNRLPSKPGTVSKPMASGHGMSSAGYSGGKCTLSKVPSLMFDMEDGMEEESHGRGDDVEAPEPHMLTTLQLLLNPQDDEEYMLSRHVSFAKEDALRRRGNQLNVEELGERLRTLGYMVKMKTGLGGDGTGSSCLRNLRHSFLEVQLSPGEELERTVIVDPRFLDQFEIAHSTVRYTCLLSAVPTNLVVTMPRLSEAVGILCTEMARAFNKVGTPLPPWRQTAAMLSKWQPRRSQEVEVAQTHRSAKYVQNGLSYTMRENNYRPRHQKKSSEYTVAQKLALMGIEVLDLQPVTPPSDCGEDLEAAWSTDMERAGDYSGSVSSENPLFASEDERESELNNTIALVDKPVFSI